MESTPVGSERTIKSWDYAVTKGRFFKNGQYTLKLTDKRLISIANTKAGDERTDIKLDDISGVSVATKKGSIFLGILCLILGVVLTVLAFVITLPIIAAGAVLLLLGIVMIVCVGSSISVVIYVKSHEMPFISANSISRRKRMRRVRVKVNRDAANEIASQLSTYLLVR